MKSVLIIFLCLGTYVGVQAQAKKKINIINSERIESNPNLYNGFTVLNGDVVLEHKGSTLYADTVIYNMEKDEIWAKSRVRFLVGDTVTLACQNLEYTGQLEQAIATGNVILKDKSQTLETDKLIYDRKTNKAYYNTRSKIIQQGNIMYSDRGEYDLTGKYTQFEKNVELQTKDNIIRSNNLRNYNNQNLAVFTGPTYIEDRKKPQNYIYTEDGKYYTKRKEAYLKTNSRIHFDGKILKGNDLYFNQVTGFGKGKNGVMLEDPQEKRFIKGGYGEVYQFKDSVMITEKPYAVKAFKTDSLYISSDTLIAKRDSLKKSKVIGYHKVRFYKSDLQGRGDSLSFQESKGELYLYKDPIVWSGYRQLYGDTIVTYMNTEFQVLDSIRIYQNAFAISKVDSITTKEYQQVKGKYMLALFNDEELAYVKVNGNAESLVYVDEEDAEKQTKERIGINKSICGRIEADFQEQQVRIVTCKINAEAQLFPEDMVPESSRYLPGFVWYSQYRLQKWNDIFSDFPDSNPPNFTPVVQVSNTTIGPTVKGSQSKPTTSNPTENTNTNQNPSISNPLGGSQNTSREKVLVPR